MAVVRTVKDLNRDALAGIIGEHVGRNDVIVTDVGAFDALDVTMYGEGGGFCSDLKRTTIKYK